MQTSSSMSFLQDSKSCTMLSPGGSFLLFIFFFLFLFFLRMFSFLKSHLSVSDGQSSYFFHTSHLTLRMYAKLWFRDAQNHQRTETLAQCVSLTQTVKCAVAFRNSKWRWNVSRVMAVEIIPADVLPPPGTAQHLPTAQAPNLYRQWTENFKELQSAHATGSPAPSRRFKECLQNCCSFTSYFYHCLC